MNPFLNTTSLPIQNPEDVFFNSETNRFFQIKKVHDDYVEISGLCKYYSDAQTNIQRSRVSYKFISNSVPVKNIDEVGEYDGIGWRVNGEQD